MDDSLIVFIVGLLTFIAGILLLKRENRLFGDSVITTAKVVTYYEYYEHKDLPNTIMMYTIAVEYYLSDGRLIHAKEQSGSNSKKYPVGTEVKIAYSKEKPDLFILCGDNSRKIIMVGMIIVGLAMMAAIGVAAMNS